MGPGPLPDYRRAALAEPGTPELVPGYKLIRLIGEGGMGVVYEALRLEDERRVALKVMAPAVADTQAFRRRFARETEIASSLEHPHIVPVIDAGTEGKTPYLAMEYIDGTDLEQRLRRGALEPADALRVLDEVASALDAAHHDGLVHRDVKPANILLDEGERAYLSDFGLTRPASGTRMTSTGVRMGTVDYMAPEQIEDREVDARTDVYALAAVAYHALSGRVPFPRDSDMAKLYAHVNEPRPPLPPELPAEVRRVSGVIERGMARDPAERHPSAGDFARGVRAAFAGQTLELPERSVATGDAAPAVTRALGSETPTHALHQPSRRRVLRAGLAAAAALAVGAAIALVMLTSDGDQEEPLQRSAAQPPESSRDRAQPPPRGRPVPRVTAGELGDARAELRTAGFAVDVRHRYNQAEAGTVLIQRPRAGKRLERGEPVILVVSRGPEPLSVRSRLTTSSLGPIEMGMTLPEAERVAGTSFTILGNDGEGCYYLEPLVNVPGVSFMVNGEQIVRSDVSKPGVKTLSGLQVGDSERDVLATYGDQIKVEQHEYDPGGHYLIFVPEDRSDRSRMVFETDGATVTGIRAGLLPAALYIEGCS
jgi:predicted Ser/Thr protein kinase